MAESRMQAMFLVIMMFVMVFSFLSLSGAYQFSVGGKDGWVLHPSESYNHWAERNRFQVNDTILFRYPKGKDSVLVVTSDDYATCNTNNPIGGLTDGESLFKFNRSGPFFFISGIRDNCKKGQKLIIVVLAVRSNPPPSPLTPPPPASSPSPIIKPPVSPSPQTPQSPPSAVPPKAETPTPSGNHSHDGVKAPAPAPKNSAMSLGFGSSGSVLVWCVSVGVSLLVIGSFGMF